MAHHPGSTVNFSWDGFLIVLGFLIGGAMATLWLVPSAPRSLVGWGSAVAVGPLALLALAALQGLGEGATELLRRVPPVRHLLAWLDAVTAGRRFSWLRIGVALIPVAMLFGLTVLATYLVGHATAGRLD